uniref:Serpin domain-containing protein n=1 Tax=Crocodylus porosus TaxID=8502 RepID=A0A7M4EPF2_CROPO
MKSTLSLCLLFVGYCILCQEELNPPEEHFQAEGNVTGENMLCHKIAPSNADFAFRFYRQASSEAAGKNVFFSPLSISAAFAMLARGAKSATRNQILEALTFNLTEIEEQEIHDGFHHLIQLLNSPDSEVQLSMGNALFVDVHLNLLQKFVDDVKKFYDSKVFASNFEDPEHLAKAKKQINDYIMNKTQGKITNLVKDLNQDTLLVLVNYIFFKGKLPLLNSAKAPYLWPGLNGSRVWIKPAGHQLLISGLDDLLRFLPALCFYDIIFSMSLWLRRISGLNRWHNFYLPLRNIVKLLPFIIVEYSHILGWDAVST